MYIRGNEYFGNWKQVQKCLTKDQIAIDVCIAFKRQPF